MPEPIPITGCCHDVFGHALKALGILRALNMCALEEHLDREAEAWWDVASGTYFLRSRKYPTESGLARFFDLYFRPTLIFSPWNTGGGLDDKQEAVITFTKLIQNKKGTSRPAKPSEADVKRLIGFFFRNRKCFGGAGIQAKERIRTARENIPKSGELRLTLRSPDAIASLKFVEGITLRVEQKASGEKAVMARIERAFKHDALVQGALRLGREFFPKFQAATSVRERRELLAQYRDKLDAGSVVGLDSVLAAQSPGLDGNPIFLDRGKAGNTEIFRSFWSNFLEFLSNPRSQIQAALYGGAGRRLFDTEAPGAPFFPDQIKTYNDGLAWIVSAFPFCALDYILAVEGALAFRGSVARLLGARHGNFAAFPFVFETAEEMTDDRNDVKGPAPSLWLPIWDRPATFEELESFILDSQARLPGREARFSAEFVRAIRSQGVDAGFVGYQEFRFKMRGARVPWVCTGRYLAAGGQRSTCTAELLAPIDESGFLDQLQDAGDGAHHREVLGGILDAVEEATGENEPRRYLTILERLFEAMRLLSVSKRFRETIEKTVGRPVFISPLPQAPWLLALNGLDVEAEFEIARAIASILGHAAQRDGKWSGVEPFLGSILPLKLDRNGWGLPKPPSPQAVWSHADLGLSLGRALTRRYHDSRRDDRPAFASPYPARLSTVLRFLYGDLDDLRIARYTEALSLIGWHSEASQAAIPLLEADEPRRPIPLPYAAIRSLLEAELHPPADANSRRCLSVRAMALLREQSGAGVGAATAEASHQLGVIGVPNPYGAAMADEKPYLRGRNVVHIERDALLVTESIISRVAAAACIPLRWHDHFALLRAITLPQRREVEETYE